MARKNLYNDVDLSNVKKEIERNVSYLQTQNLEDFIDDLDWNATSNGGSILVVVSSVEQKLNAYITIIKDSVEQLSYIVSIEGVSDFVIYNLDLLKEMLSRMYFYYDQRPPEMIENRNHYEERTSKAGKTSTLKKLVANIQTQIQSRSRVQKAILLLQPIIKSLEDSIEEEVKLKGDKIIPLLYRLLGYV